MAVYTTLPYVLLVFLPGLRGIFTRLKNFADLTRTCPIAFQFITRNFVPRQYFRNAPASLF